MIVVVPVPVVVPVLAVVPVLVPVLVVVLVVVLVLLPVPSRSRRGSRPAGMVGREATDPGGSSNPLPERSSGARLLQEASLPRERAKRARAGEGIRTLDVDLGKVALYH